MNNIFDYNKFLEKNKLNSDFDQFINRLDIKDQIKHNLKEFFKMLKDEGEDKIISEIKYRVTDGEDIVDVMVDILDNKLGDTRSNFWGRNTVVANILYRREDNKIEPEKFKIVMGLVSTLKSKGTKFLKDNLDTKELEMIKPYVKDVRDMFKKRQEIHSWAGREESDINQEIIDDISKFLNEI